MCQTRKEIQAKAPKRPYKNFTDFCIQQCTRKSRLLAGVPFFPCLVCLARGWHYHPDSEPDPCDGNRHRETVQCEACKGTGQGTKKVCFAKYREAIERWEVETILFKVNVTRRKRALAKLTLSEIFALKALGL